MIFVHPMFRKLIPIIAPVLIVSACVSPPAPAPVEVNKSDDINTRLFALEETLLESFTEVCRDKESELRKQLATSNSQLSNSRTELEALTKQCNTKDGSRKLLLGEIEEIELLDQELSFEARIDSGAETSSLGVYKLQKFERDGKDWVKFALQPDKKAAIHEYPVHDNVRIKNQEKEGSESRYEIKLDLKVGKKIYRNQLFNLSSRRHFEYQVLIGRSFLRDIAIVDVGTKHRLKRK